MTMEDFLKILVPAALGAVGGYGAIRAELSAMRAQVNILLDTISEMRRRMDQWADTKGH